MLEKNKKLKLFILHAIVPAFLVWFLLITLSKDFLQFLQVLFMVYAIIYIPYSLRKVRSGIITEKRLSVKIYWRFYVLYSALTIWGGLVMFFGFSLKSISDFLFNTYGALFMITAIIISISLTAACVFFAPLKSKNGDK